MKTVAVISPFHQRYLSYCKGHPNQRNIEAFFLVHQVGVFFDEVVVLAESEEWDANVATAYELAVSRTRR